MATTVVKSPYLRDPEVQLMLRVKAGDEAAFETLVKAYQDRLVNIFTNMVGDQESAEDLAQEVFLRVYRARNGYEPTAKFSTWVFRIANNLASNTRRTKGRRKEVQLRPADSGTMSQQSSEQMLPDKSSLMPTRQAARTELQQRVWDAMGELNERQRMAILLHRFEDMSYADIGAAMDLSTEAVKSLLSRARENLRMLLESYVQR